ncbi:MAG: hypothetical protein AAB483_02810 [Patescibacteria group bacterium]
MSQLEVVCIGVIIGIVFLIVGWYAGKKSGKNVGFDWGVGQFKKRLLPGDKLVAIGGPFDFVRILQDRGLFNNYQPVTHVMAAIIRKEAGGEVLLRTELAEENFADGATLHNVTHGDNMYVNTGGKVERGDMPDVILRVVNSNRRVV